MLEVARSIYSRMGSTEALALAGATFHIHKIAPLLGGPRPAYMCCVLICQTLFAQVLHDLGMMQLHKLRCADVYVLLGDIGMEEERFDSSATDYESALKLLMQNLEVGIIGARLYAIPTPYLSHLLSILWLQECSTPDICVDDGLPCTSLYNDCAPCGPCHEADNLHCLVMGTCPKQACGEDKRGCLAHLCEALCRGTTGALRRHTTS